MIGIHCTKGLYSERWVAYCEEKGIDYKLVNCYGNDIIRQLEDCDALMWHYSHKSPRASKFAKELLYALQVSGKKVFPDFNTVWHFDDKIGQKYLLEANGIPYAPAHVFYEKKEALHWAAKTSYPKVFKLRNGSSSDNVILVTTREQANMLIRKAFGRGYKQYKGWSNLKERYRKYQAGMKPFREVIKGIGRLFWPPEYARVTDREMGYAYFQEFVPGCKYDYRVLVTGSKALAHLRQVRKNDFRASGSGIELYDRELIPEELIKLSFEITEKLRVQCLVFDFVYQDGTPLVLEISYGTTLDGYENCGHFDRDLNWYDSPYDFAGEMVEEVLANIRKDKGRKLDN